MNQNVLTTTSASVSVVFCTFTKYNWLLQNVENAAEDNVGK